MSGKSWLLLNEGELLQAKKKKKKKNKETNILVIWQTEDGAFIGI